MRLILFSILLFIAACTENVEQFHMGALADSTDSLVIRTEYSDEATWSKVRSAIAAPSGSFRADVKFVDDRKHDGLTIEQLFKLLPEGSNHTFIFLADRETLFRSDHPVLVVDLFGQRGRTFRVIPSEIWSVENNLSLANMDWEDFADNLDEDGIFRGFPE